MAKMSLSTYARHRGVRLNAVQYQIERGTIVRDEAGLVDTEQADAAWQPRTQPTDEQARRRRAADLTSVVVKFNLAKVQLERLQTKHIERAFASEVLLGEVDEILHALSAVPPRYAGILAGLINVDRGVAEAILDRIVGKTLAELGDVKAEAQHCLDRL